MLLLGKGHALRSKKTFFESVSCIKGNWEERTVSFQRERAYQMAFDGLHHHPADNEKVSGGKTTMVNV